MRRVNEWHVSQLPFSTILWLIIVGVLALVAFGVLRNTEQLLGQAASCNVPATGPFASNATNWTKEDGSLIYDCAINGYHAAGCPGANTPGNGSIVSTSQTCGTPSGVFGYKTTFQITGPLPQGTRLIVDAVGDDTPKEVVLNGTVFTNYTKFNYAPEGFRYVVDKGFQQGLNTLIVRHDNGPGEESMNIKVQWNCGGPALPPPCGFLPQASSSSSSKQVSSSSSSVCQVPAETPPDGVKQGLKLRYTFDNGTANDTSGQNTHGKVPAGSGATLQDSCAIFDGVDDRIDLPNLDAEKFTFAAWVRPEYGNQGAPVILSSNIAQGWAANIFNCYPPPLTSQEIQNLRDREKAFQFFSTLDLNYRMMPPPVSRSGCFSLVCTDCTLYQNTMLSSYEPEKIFDGIAAIGPSIGYDEKFYHVAVSLNATRQGDNVNGYYYTYTTVFYLNGQKVGTDEDFQYYPVLRDFFAGFTLGYHQKQWSLPRSTFKGLMDDVRMYDRVLSDAEVQQISQTRFNCGDPSEGLDVCTGKEVSCKDPPAPKCTGLDCEEKSYYNGREYIYYNLDETISWGDAERVCEQLGGTLAITKTKEERDIVQKLIGGTKTAGSSSRAAVSVLDRISGYLLGQEEPLPASSKKSSAGKAASSGNFENLCPNRVWVGLAATEPYIIEGTEDTSSFKWIDGSTFYNAESFWYPGQPDDIPEQQCVLINQSRPVGKNGFDFACDGEGEVKAFVCQRVPKTSRSSSTSSFTIPPIRECSPTLKAGSLQFLEGGLKAGTEIDSEFSKAGMRFSGKNGTVVLIDTPRPQQTSSSIPLTDLQKFDKALQFTPDRIETASEEALVIDFSYGANGIGLTLLPPTSGTGIILAQAFDKNDNLVAYNRFPFLKDRPTSVSLLTSYPETALPDQDIYRISKVTLSNLSRGPLIVDNVYYSSLCKAPASTSQQGIAYVCRREDEEAFNLSFDGTGLPDGSSLDIEPFAASGGVLLSGGTFRASGNNGYITFPEGQSRICFGEPSVAGGYGNNLIDTTTVSFDIIAPDSSVDPRVTITTPIEQKTVTQDRQRITFSKKMWVSCVSLFTNSPVGFAIDNLSYTNYLCLEPSSASRVSRSSSSRVSSSTSSRSSSMRSSSVRSSSAGSSTSRSSTPSVVIDLSSSPFVYRNSSSRSPLNPDYPVYPRSDSVTQASSMKFLQPTIQLPDQEGSTSSFRPVTQVYVSSARGRQSFIATACGNSTIDAGEECDDGNRSDFDGCTVDCLFERGFCGDGVVQRALGERCEAAATPADAGYTCNEQCRPVLVFCGDGKLNPGEKCDDGIRNSNVADQACRTDCSAARCGDAIIDLTRGEGCDDGNRLSGDGCSAICVPERPSAAVQVSQFGIEPRPVASLPTPTPNPLVAFALPPVTASTGPASIAVMAAGAAAGMAYVRRKRS